jgi:predicted esterase
MRSRMKRMAATVVVAMMIGCPGALAQASDVESVPSVERKVGGDEKRTYFLIGHDETEKPPREGSSLLVVLPGGDGGKDFNTFVRRMHRNALSKDWVVAQVVAPVWAEGQAEKLVWPTERSSWPGMKFTTEELVESVIKDVRKSLPVNARNIFVLAWSSGGPAAYAILLQDRTAVRGAYIAMSVFHPDALPSLKKARGRSFFLDHSPEDTVCPFKQAEEARDELKKAGARVELETYDGGHGWKGDVYGRLKRGIRFLEQGAKR